MAIPFLTDFEFTYGQPQQISAHVRRLVANNPGPFSGWGTNVYLVGKDDLIIIDPGPDTDQHFEVLCKAVGYTRVRAVLVTHHHLDHSAMAPRLATHFSCQTHSFGPPKTQIHPKNALLEAGNDQNFTPDIQLKDGQIIDGDHWHIRCVHTPGHTSNHMCYAVMPDNGLIVGDHVLAWSTSIIIPPDGKMNDYLLSLQQVRQLDFTELWPGHGPAISKPEPFLNAYLAHRKERDMQILNCLKNQMQQIKQMVPVIYPDIDLRLYPAASISVLAHLIRMIEIGRVCCEGEPSITSKFEYTG